VRLSARPMKNIPYHKGSRLDALADKNTVRSCVRVFSARRVHVSAAFGSAGERK